MIELLGGIATLISALYARNKDSKTWIWGIIASILYGIYFYKIEFHINCILQILWIGVSLNAYFDWREFVIHKLDLIFCFIIGTLAIFFISQTKMVNLFDTVSGEIVLIATILLWWQKRINWIFWGIYNIIMCYYFITISNYSQFIIYFYLIYNSYESWLEWKNIKTVSS